jgi:hypothetical protein
LCRSDAVAASGIFWRIDWLCSAGHWRIGRNRRSVVAPTGGEQHRHRRYARK